MPSPIAHSISGYALSRLPFVNKQLPGKVIALTPLAALYGIFVSCLPDLDFLPQIVTGIRFHRGPSHSLVAAVLVSALLAFVIHRFRKSTRRQTHYGGLFKLTIGFYGMHLLMDLVTAGGSGMPLLWPLSDRTFSAPFSLFPPVHHSRGLWDMSHLTFISVELLYAVVLFAVIGFIKGRRQPGTDNT